MMFDTWGGTLAHDDYEPFSLAYSRKVFEKVKGAPTILFTKGGNPWLGAMMQSGCDAVGLDWTSDARARAQIGGGRVALQGNLDPVALFAPPERVREAARKVLDASAPRRDTSSISATESCRKHLWNQWPRW